MISDDPDDEVIAAAMPDPGTKLYKLRSVRGDERNYARDILVNHRLWYSSPLSFNDPFDCLPVAQISGSDASLARHERALMQKMMADAWRTERRSALRTMRNTTRAQKEANWARTIAGTREQFSVCSMTLDPASVLMWGHYADSHRGIAIQFEVYDESAGRVPFGIIYHEERPVIDFIDRDDKAKLLEAAILRKADFWSYEREVRYVVQGMKEPGYRPFPKSSLTGIILGAAISPQDEEDVRAWADQGRLAVPFRRARMDDRLYRLHLDDA